MARIAWSAEDGAELRSTVSLAADQPLGPALQLVGDHCLAASADGTALCQAPLASGGNLRCQPVSQGLGGGAGLVAALQSSKGAVVLGTAGAAVYKAAEGGLQQGGVFQGT